MAESRILLSPPDVGEAERNALLEAFDSNWIAPVGPHINKFEEEFARYTDTPNAVALSSGTAALHLALLLAGVGPGDTVIVPTLTFIATANAVKYVGAEPCFVDVLSDSWTLDPTLLREAVEKLRARGRSVSAVLAVDLYGQCCDYIRLSQVCEDFGVALIADAAESLGATFDGKPAGSLTGLSAFSFNGNKIMTTSGGGMLTCSEELGDRARYLASQARHPVDYYHHTEIGFNYRMSNLLAALGSAQLSQLDDRMAKRKRTNERYSAAIEEMSGIAGMMPFDPQGEPNCWLSVALLESADPESVCRALGDIGIEARMAWKPMHLQPVFSNSESILSGVADYVFSRGVCLPSGSSLSEAQQDRVITSLDAVMRSHGSDEVRAP